MAWGCSGQVAAAAAGAALPGAEAPIPARRPLATGRLLLGVGRVGGGPGKGLGGAGEQGQAGETETEPAPGDRGRPGGAAGWALDGVGAYRSHGQVEGMQSVAGVKGQQPIGWSTRPLRAPEGGVRVRGAQ